MCPESGGVPQPRGPQGRRRLAGCLLWLVGWGPLAADPGADLTAALDRVSTPVPFALILERADGAVLAYHREGAPAQRTYESASTSKWVAAAVILRLVDQGKLSLADRPSRYLSFWPRPGTPLGDISLAQLLSFTSGLEKEPLTMNLGGADFFEVVDRIAELNKRPVHGPGEAFVYSATHLQVAGAMAVRATGLPDWASVFRAFCRETGLFPHSTFDLPSLSNPRLAGGMHWTAEDYLGFLRAFQGGQVLSPALRDQMVADQTAGVWQAKSPVADSLGEVWSYGFGLWREPGTDRVSSPGAYGAYPFWDRTRNYWGILARQGRLGSYPEGLAVERSVRPLIEAWARDGHPQP